MLRQFQALWRWFRSRLSLRRLFRFVELMGVLGAIVALLLGLIHWVLAALLLAIAFVLYLWIDDLLEKRERKTELIRQLRQLFWSAKDMHEKAGAALNHFTQRMQRMPTPYPDMAALLLDHVYAPFDKQMHSTSSAFHPLSVRNGVPTRREVNNPRYLQVSLLSYYRTYQNLQKWILRLAHLLGFTAPLDSTYDNWLEAEAAFRQRAARLLTSQSFAHLLTPELREIDWNAEPNSA